MTEGYMFNDDDVADFSKQLMDDEFRPIDRVYIDLNCIKDTRMGLMLSLSSKDRQNYLISGLPRYNKRYDRKFTTCYTEFPYNEDKLQKLYKDEKYQLQAFNHAPDTDLLYDFSYVLKGIAAVNLRANYTGKVTFDINFYPLRLEKMRDAYITILNYMYRESKFVFRSMFIRPSRMDSFAWRKYRLQFIDDILPLLPETSGWSEACFKNADLQNSHVFCAYQLDDEHRAAWIKDGLNFNDDKAVTDQFDLTEAMMNTFTKFNFTRFVVPLPEQVKTPVNIVTTK